jgi:hypothetical protein
MSTRIVSLLIFCSLTVLPTAPACAASIVDLPYIQRQLNVDGRVTPDEVNGAAVIELTAMGELAKPKNPTKVYALLTPSALYIAFVCEDSAPANLVSTVRKTNGPVFEDDSVEVLFTPAKEGNKYNYFHFAVNTAGITYSSSMADDIQVENWECAVKPTAKGWEAEIAIPLASVRGSTDMAYWRANIARNRAARGSEPAEKSVWVDPGTTLHNFRKFGYLKLPRSLQPGYQTSPPSPAGFGGVTTGTPEQIRDAGKPATGFGEPTTVTIPQTGPVPGFATTPTP